MSVSDSLTIRHGVAADAAELSQFMARTFVNAFGAQNDPQHLAAYLAESYSPEKQAAELADPAVTTLIAELGGQWAGYAQVRAGGNRPPCVTGPAPIELARFYVNPALIGRGVAAPLMARVKLEATARGGRTLWLGVWEVNARGIAFYRKSGFAEVGTHTFRVGGDVQRDLVMVATLAG